MCQFRTASINLLALLAGMSICIAQPPPKGPPSGPPPPHPLMQALDTDGDGTLSAEEIEQASASLKKIDRDANGKLTPDELRPRFPGAKKGKERRPGEELPKDPAKAPPAAAASPASTKSAAVGGIQWIPTLAAGLKEAKRSQRPILFVSAAPHCGGVSGMW